MNTCQDKDHFVTCASRAATSEGVEACARQRVEAQERAKAEAEEKAGAEVEAQRQREAQALAKLEAKKKAEAECQAFAAAEKIPLNEGDFTVKIGSMGAVKEIRIIFKGDDPVVLQGVDVSCGAGCVQGSNEFPKRVRYGGTVDVVVTCTTVLEVAVQTNRGTVKFHTNDD
jgi:hypothetical protein